MKRCATLLVILLAAVSPASAQDSGPAGMLNRFTRGWARSDAAAIGRLFAPDADLVAPDGVFPQGRVAITGYYAAAFAHGYAGSTLTGEVVRQRTLAPGLILLDGRFTISGAHRPDGSSLPTEHGALAAVLRDGLGGWQILAQRERDGDGFTPMSAPPDRGRQKAAR